MELLGRKRKGERGKERKNEGEGRISGTFGRARESCVRMGGGAGRVE